MSYDLLTPAASRLWPFSPDWSGGFNVQRSFETDIVTSRNDTEQRRSLRINPRFSIDYRAVVSGADLREASLFLRAWQNKPTLVTDYARWARLTGASIVGATTLTIAPMPAWVAAGQPLVLCGETRETVIVLSVAGSTITLEDPLVAAWGVDSVLRPTFHGLLDGKISTRRKTHGAAEIVIVLDAYPGGSPPRAAGTAYATLDTREILTFEPDYSGSPSVAHVWPVEQVDVDRGRTAQFRPVDRAALAIENDYAGLTVTQASQLEQFFDRMKGRRGAFYMPTGEKDFDLAATAGAATATFLSTGLAIADDFGAIDYAAYELAVCVYLTDGSKIYRRVTDVSSTGVNSRVTVAAAWGVELTTANVARISLMPLWRFASDEMTMSWQTPLHARARLTFQTVRR